MYISVKDCFIEHLTDNTFVTVVFWVHACKWRQRAGWTPSGSPEKNVPCHTAQGGETTIKVPKAGSHSTGMLATYTS